MSRTSRKRVLVAGVAGIALIGSGMATAALASTGDSGSPARSAVTGAEVRAASAGAGGARIQQAGGSGQGQSNGPKVTEHKAVEIAKGKAPGTVTEAELDSDDGRQVWEIEIDGKDNREHDLDISASTGKILSHETDDADGRDDDDDRDDRNEDDRDDDRDDRDDRDDDRDGDDDRDDRDDRNED